MKKLFAAGAALLLTSTISQATEAYEEAGISITGDSRARLIFKDNYDFGNSDDSAETTMDSRVRLNITGTAAGGAYVHARIRLAEGKFDGEADASDEKNIYVDKAYIGIPFTDEFTLEAGKYRVSYGNGFMYDDIGLAGFRGTYDTDAYRIIPFLEVQSEGQESDDDTDVSEDNDSYRFGAAANYKGDGWNLGALAAYQTDDRTVVDTPDEGFFGTLFGRSRFGMFGVEGEFSYAEAGLSDFTGEEDGWGGYIRGLWYRDALTLSLDVGFTKDGFIPDNYYGFIMVGGDHPITVDDIGDTGDWTWGGLTGKYALTESLSLTGNLVYVNIDGNEDLGVTDDRLAKYFEASGGLSYNISKGTTFSWYAGYLQPDYDGEIEDIQDDPAFGTYAKFEIEF